MSALARAYLVAGINLGLAALLALALFIVGFGYSEVGYFFEHYEQVVTSPEAARVNPAFANITPADLAKRAKDRMWEAASHVSLLGGAAAVLLLLCIYELRLIHNIERSVSDKPKV
jgi:hypothetical protein